MPTACHGRRPMPPFVLAVALLVTLRALDDGTFFGKENLPKSADSTLIKSAHGTKYLESNLTPTQQDNKKEFPIVPICRKIRLNWKCPDRMSYVGKCFHLSSFNRSQTGIPELNHETDETFLQDLLASLHGRRIAFIGDSIMRQWYETLVCRLGLVPRWFKPHPSAPPARIQDATTSYDLHFTKMNNPPLGFHGARGYSIASTSFPMSQKGVTKRAGQEANLGEAAAFLANAEACNASETVENDNSTLVFETTLEYFKVAKLKTAAPNPSPDFHNTSARVLLDFLFQEADVAIFNFGIHYGTNVLEDDDVYSSILNELFEACGSFQSRDDTKRCLYLMTIPQHWAYVRDVNFPPNWRFNRSQVRHTCRRSLDKGVNNLVFGTATTSLLEELSRQHSVPLIKNEDIFADAGMWHLKDDCTHFCQDPLLWDLLHERLVKHFPLW